MTGESELPEGEMVETGGDEEEAIGSGCCC